MSELWLHPWVNKGQWACTQSSRIHSLPREAITLPLSRLQCLPWTNLDLEHLAPFALSSRLHDLILLVNVYMHTIPKGSVVLPLLHKHVCSGPHTYLCLAAEPLRGFPLPLSDGTHQGAATPRSSLAGMGHTASGCSRERIARCEAWGVKHPLQSLCLGKFLI